MTDSRAGRIASWLALAAVILLIAHLEMRLSAQNDELRALHRDVTSRGGEIEQPSAGPTMPWVPPASRGAIDSDTIGAIARAVVQLEAQRALASASSRPADEAPPRTGEQEKAVAAASDVATRAVARGRISREDVLKMREDLASGQATDAERDALRSQIAMAINAQKLVPEDPHFIYP